MHFGPAKAANDRIGDRAADKPSFVLPVVLSIKNPLRMDDLLDWHRPLLVARGMVERGVFSKKEFDVLQKIADETGDPKAVASALVSFLKEKGFDGIVYVNAVEGRGQKSWIAFDPTQIKSVHNRGTFDPADPRILFDNEAAYGAAQRSARRRWWSL